MTYISIEEIRDIQRRRREINDYDLEDIIFTFEGEPIQVSKEEVENFKYTGLNNIDFVEIILEKQISGESKGLIAQFFLTKK